MKTLSTILFLLLSANLFSQNDSSKYFWQSHNFGTTYTYEVMEIEIHPDSTFTWKVWDVGNKKNRKDYKLYKPSVKQGSIARKGNYLILTEFYNGKESDTNWLVKISKRSIRIYFYFEDKLMRGAKYKRKFKQ